MTVNGVALGAVAVGSVFTYAGLKGVSVPQAFQAIVQGKSPATLPQTAGIDTPVELPPSTDSSVGGGTATGQAIANDALKYKGAGYVWGGPADRPGNWDCSSFVSYVLGHDLNYTLPGGGHYGAAGFPPHQHGPTTTTYHGYGKSITRAQVGAGDLVVWPTHIGIAISNTTMISARSQTSGTGTSSIDGDTRYFHQEPTCRRVGT
jgi:cell wall-associated NlpC family hydrolase